MPYKIILDNNKAEEVKDAKLTNKDLLSQLNNKFYDALQKEEG